jgi:hypothetical protein
MEHKNSITTIKIWFVQYYYSAGTLKITEKIRLKKQKKKSKNLDREEEINTPEKSISSRFAI